MFLRLDKAGPNCITLVDYSKNSVSRKKKESTAGRRESPHTLMKRSYPYGAPPYGGYEAPFGYEDPGMNGHGMGDPSAPYIGPFHLRLQEVLSEIAGYTQIKKNNLFVTFSILDIFNY